MLKAIVIHSWLLDCTAYLRGFGPHALKIKIAIAAGIAVSGQNTT